MKKILLYILIVAFGLTGVTVTGVRVAAGGEAPSSRLGEKAIKEQHITYIFSVVWSPDGKRLASGDIVGMAFKCIYLFPRCSIPEDYNLICSSRGKPFAVRAPHN